MTQRITFPKQLDLFVGETVDNVNEACSHTKVETRIYHVNYHRCCGCGSILEAATRDDTVSAYLADLVSLAPEEPPFEADDYYEGQFDNGSESE